MGRYRGMARLQSEARGRDKDEAVLRDIRKGVQTWPSAAGAPCFYLRLSTANDSWDTFLWHKWNFSKLYLERLRGWRWGWKVTD